MGVAAERALAESVSFTTATRETPEDGLASLMLISYELSLPLSLDQGLVINPEGVPGAWSGRIGVGLGGPPIREHCKARFESSRHMGIWHDLFCLTTHTRHMLALQRKN
jgi:hypothetical protein